MNVIQVGAATVVAIGTIGGGALTVDQRYTQQEVFYQHVADSRVGTILELVERASGADGSYKGTLCKALLEELGAVCTAAPEHPMCVDRREYLQQAGC